MENRINSSKNMHGAQADLHKITQCHGAPFATHHAYHRRQQHKDEVVDAEVCRVFLEPRHRLHRAPVQDMSRRTASQDSTASAQVTTASCCECSHRVLIDCSSPLRDLLASRTRSGPPARSMASAAQTAVCTNVSRGVPPSCTLVLGQRPRDRRYSVKRRVHRRVPLQTRQNCRGCSS